jgi:uncharacterized protein
LIPDNDAPLKDKALTAVTNHPVLAVSGDRWADSRHPSDVDIKSTRVLSFEPSHISAKVREGEPKDEKKDIDDEEVNGKYWTGVIRMKKGFEDYKAASYARSTEVPEYVKKLVQ